MKYNIEKIMERSKDQSIESKINRNILRSLINNEETTFEEQKAFLESQNINLNDS